MRSLRFVKISSAFSADNLFFVKSRKLSLRTETKWTELKKVSWSLGMEFGSGRVSPSESRESEKREDERTSRRRGSEGARNERNWPRKSTVSNTAQQKETTDVFSVGSFCEQNENTWCFSKCLNDHY